LPEPRSDHARRESSGDEGRELVAITEGEVNFLWSFIQGSLVNPETWNSLLGSYGFCERHAWIHMSIEMAFRDEYLLGPTILYGALIEKALNALRIAPRISGYSVERRLRPDDACLLCTLNIKEALLGACSKSRLDRGRSTQRLQTFAFDLEPLWSSRVCDACRDQDGGSKNPAKSCRKHLLADMRARRRVDLSRQQESLQELYAPLIRYQNSFLAGGRAASNDERAALIAAIGWCSGWRPMLYLCR
jgi:hypothetical protein